MTLNLITDYLEFIEKRRGLRPLTVKTYGRTLASFAEWMDDMGVDGIPDLTPELVEDFGWRPLGNGQPPSNSTARREMMAVIQFLKWCAGRRQIPTTAHMAVVTPATPDRRPNPIDDATWIALWGSDLRDDDRLFLGLAFFLGQRRFEIVTQPPEAVLIGRQVMRFERKRGKVREVEYRAVTETLANSLPHLTEGWEEWVGLLEQTALYRAGERYLWPHSNGDAVLDGNNITRRLYTLCKQAGIERFGGPHRLRHSAATNLFRAGLSEVVVCDILGHESIDTTRGYLSVAGTVGRLLDQKQGALT